VTTATGPTGVYWGELPALAEGIEVTSTTGFEPMVATIRALRSDVSDWILRHDPKRLEGLEKIGSVLAPNVAAALTKALPERAPQIKALPSRADFLVLEVQSDGQSLRRLPLPRMFLTDVRVVDDLEPAMLELTLADVRWLWRDHGELTIDFNVRVGTDEAGRPVYDPLSLPLTRDEPWRAREVLQHALDQLPGQPKIERFDPDDAVFRELRTGGASPLEVAQAVVAELDAVFALNLDGSCAIYSRGSGPVGETPNGRGPYNTELYDPGMRKGVWDRGAIPAGGDLYHLRPAVDQADEVVVVGPRPIYSTRLDYLEPVVPLELPARDGGPPVSVTLPVTPDLLDRIAALLGPDRKAKEDAQAIADRGEADPNGFTFKFSLNVVLPGRPGPAGLSAPSQLLTLDTTNGDLRRKLLLMAPFFGDGWPAPFFDVPEPIRQQLTERLWRFFRIPDRYWRRFGPILDRAERDARGGRLPPLVEAFGFRPIRVAGVEDEAPEGVTPDQRTEAEVQFAFVCGELELVVAELNKIATVETFAQLKAFADRELAHASAKQAPGATHGAAAAPQAAADASAKPTPDLHAVVEAVKRGAVVSMAAVLGLKNPEDLDPTARKVEDLTRRRADLERQREQLREKIDPAAAARRKLLAATKAYTAAIAASGVPSLPLLAAVQAAQAELTAAVAAGPPAVAKRAVQLLQHYNGPRVPVAATILEDGRTVELEEPAVWLADPRVSDPSETWAVPMPVAITFGSWNREDQLPAPALPAGTFTDNELLQASLELIAAGGPLAVFNTSLGHVLPLKPSPGAIRFTYSRAERKSGKARIGRHPRRIVRGAELQVYYPLPRSTDRSGADNFAEALSRATALADALFVARERESGTVTVLGPRPVNVNGRIASVRWVGDEAGNVDTVVFFGNAPDEDLEPETIDLPPGPLVLGLDLDSFR
jgi:hypothetical protein